MNIQFGVMIEIQYIMGHQAEGLSLIIILINEYVPFIRNFITTNNIQIIGDLGCGSCFNLISLYSDLNIIYFGYDAYDKIIIYNQLKQLQPMYKYNFFS